MLAKHVFFDYIEVKFAEIKRVFKSGNMITLILGNIDEDNQTYSFLLNKGLVTPVF